MYFFVTPPSHVTVVLKLTKVVRKVKNVLPYKDIY